MKNYLKTLFFVSFCSFTVYFMTGVVSKSFAADNKISVKCHVSLIDGSQNISFWDIHQKHLRKLSQRVVGTKVRKTATREMVSIFKVYECLPEGEEFSSKAAQLLESKTPR